MTSDDPHQCMDIDQISHPKDKEIKQIWKQKLTGKEIDQLSKSEKHQLVQELKYATNAGLRQLAHITHKGYHIIRRL